MKRRTLLSGLVAAGGYSLIGGLSAAEPKAPSQLKTDGKVGFGVYLGAGCTGVKRLDAYEQWLNRKVDQTLEFVSWDVVYAGGNWGPKCWDQGGQQNVVYSIPMLPGKHGSLAEGAKGGLDHLFRRYGDVLVKHGYGHSVLRIGWEFNADWYPWAASKDPKSWITYWQRIVDALRKTPDSSFRFDWSVAGAARGFDAEKAYPGDDYVDYVGLDYYNTTIDPKADSDEERWQARMNMQHGLKWQRDFAKAHGKAISLPEWGTGVHVKWGGPRDDPYFIEGMAAWIRDNDVAYHNYWEYKNKDYNSRLANSEQPQASAAFLKSFGGRSASLDRPAQGYA